MVYRRGAAACVRSQQHREDILRAARAVVARDGIDGLGMSAVATEAGVAVGSLYRHFASRSELTTEVLRTTCAHELDVLRAVAAGETDPVERLGTAVAVFARRALSSGRLAYAMICEPTVAEAEQLRRRIRAEMASILAGIVRDGVDAGRFPPQDPLATGLALVGAVSEVLTAPEGYRPRGGRSAVVDSVTALAVRAAGVAA